MTKKIHCTQPLWNDIDHTVLTQMKKKIQKFEEWGLVPVSLLPQFSDEREIEMYKFTVDKLNVGNLIDAVACTIAVKQIIAVRQFAHGNREQHWNQDIQ